MKKPTNLNIEMRENMDFAIDTVWDSVNVYEKVKEAEHVMWELRDQLDIILGEDLADVMEAVLAEDIGSLNDETN